MIEVLLYTNQKNRMDSYSIHLDVRLMVESGESIILLCIAIIHHAVIMLIVSSHRGQIIRIVSFGGLEFICSEKTGAWASRVAA